FPVDLDATFPDTNERFLNAGWEPAAANEWFLSLESIGKMPFIALLDICEEYEYSPMVFLRNFLHVENMGQDNQSPIPPVQ
ncbi:MAG: hypothetical protein ABJA67_18470, partial [Chthonomonadales bacterium]